ncbi:MAG: carboxypeptidase-like regulatory domain-containing protein, partial [Candidatus Bathyarchaeota archaeon]|nr:carboxypeptidase-like regulatory domain-containing protein [Candidatus Bathyarchaeota archaeon]
NADCYDCVSGSCTAMTEDDDGSCNDDCNSCVSGTCTNRSQCDGTECTGQAKCDIAGGDCKEPDLSSKVCTICYSSSWGQIATKCCGDDKGTQDTWCSLGGGSCLAGTWYADHCDDETKNCDEVDEDCGGDDCSACPVEEVLPVIHELIIQKAIGIVQSFTYEEITEGEVETVRLLLGKNTTLKYKSLNNLKSIFLTFNNEEYEFEKEGHLFTLAWQNPPQKGEYDLLITFIYPDDTEETQEIPILVDPLGYVYETTKKGQQERINKAKVVLYYLDEKSKTWIPWNAKDYGQNNPQTTDITGEYGFIVPKGKYYLKASKKGYQTKETEEFKIQDESINKNLELISLPSFWQRNRKKILIGAIILFGVIIFLLRKKRERQ